MTPAERVAIREAIAKLEEALVADLFELDAQDEQAPRVRPDGARCPGPDCPRCVKYGRGHDTR